ncbi:hypothetical protein FRB95_001514 [Tulasnella sp. JGI-2019a]|nr:hypothetical protein FRB95_001514 [Tulasnella sp. JGI-2019a]
MYKKQLSDHRSGGHGKLPSIPELFQGSALQNNLTPGFTRLPPIGGATRSRVGASGSQSGVHELLAMEENTSGLGSPQPWFQNEYPVAEGESSLWQGRESTTSGLTTNPESPSEPERSRDDGPPLTRKKRPDISNRWTVYTPAKYQRKENEPKPVSQPAIGGIRRRLTPGDKKAICILLGKLWVPQQVIADAYHVSLPLVSQVVQDWDWWIKYDVEAEALPEELKQFEKHGYP